MWTSRSNAAWRGGFRRWARALAAWWRADRIRVSPREGRLLRVGVGSVVQVPGDEPAVVVGRRVVGEAGSPVEVHYRCTGSTGERSLRVCARDGGEGVCVWAAPGGEAHLAPEEVRVFSAHAMPCTTIDGTLAAGLAGPPCSTPSNSCASAPRR